MNNVSDWKIPKWPFLVAGIVLFVVSTILACRPAHTITQMEITIATASVALGALFGCLPFILEYWAVKKLVEINVVTTVAEQLGDLKKYSAQIVAAQALPVWRAVRHQGRLRKNCRRREGNRRVHGYGNPRVQRISA